MDDTVEDLHQPGGHAHRGLHLRAASADPGAGPTAMVRAAPGSFVGRRDVVLLGGDDPHGGPRVGSARCGGRRRSCPEPPGAGTAGPRRPRAGRRAGRGSPDGASTATLAHGWPKSSTVRAVPGPDRARNASSLIVGSSRIPGPAPRPAGRSVARQRSASEECRCRMPYAWSSGTIRRASHSPALEQPAGGIGPVPAGAPGPVRRASPRSCGAGA